MLLHDLLTLEPGQNDVFQGRVSTGGWRRPFGGHLLAQALAAASATVEAGWPPHNLQMTFLRSGALDAPIDYVVERLRDGRRFATRRVTARQHGHHLVEALISFQLPEAGLNFHAAMPDVPPPDGLPDEAVLRAHAFATRDVDWCLSPVMPDLHCEIRPIQPRNFIDPPPMPPELDLWIRFKERADSARTPCYIASLSDVLLLSTTLLPHGLSWCTTPVEGSTLNHSLWFHEALPPDEWLLWSLRALWTGHTRGLAQGHLWRRDGSLIATAMQEGLVRLRD